MAKIVIAYVPVIHEGYRRFFSGIPRGKRFVLGEVFLGEFPHLRKEIRAMDPRAIQQALQAIGIEAEVLTKGRLKSFLGGKNQFILPDEDISREFAERHLGGEKAVFEPVFLRWDRDNSVSPKEVSPTQSISRSRFDREIMKKAHQLSKQSSDWWRRVGAVAIRDGAVLLETFNEHVPSAHSPWAHGDPRNNLKQGEGIEISTSFHAEARLIAEAARRGIPLTGTDLYVTTFPCPPCAKLIAYSGVKRLLYSSGYGVLDGEDVLKDRGVEIVLVQGVPEPRGREAIPYPETKKDPITRE